MAADVEPHRGARTSSYGISVHFGTAYCIKRWTKPYVVIRHIVYSYGTLRHVEASPITQGKDSPVYEMRCPYVGLLTFPRDGHG